MTDPQRQLADFLNSITAGRTLPLGRHGEPELDSLALLQVVTWLEQQYGIRLSELDVEPDDLRSISGILALIERCA